MADGHFLPTGRGRNRQFPDGEMGRDIHKEVPGVVSLTGKQAWGLVRSQEGQVGPAEGGPWASGSLCACMWRLPCGGGAEQGK